MNGDAHQLRGVDVVHRERRQADDDRTRIDERHVGRRHVEHRVQTARFRLIGADAGEQVRGGIVRGPKVMNLSADGPIDSPCASREHDDEVIPAGRAQRLL